MILINSINPSMHQIVLDLLYGSDISYTDPGQIIIDNYIINISFFIKECVKLDRTGCVVDGFVFMRRDEFLYRGKTVFELLGGNSLTEMGDLAKPIDPLLYGVMKVNTC